ncbi:MAG: HEAT repeat domain-containing protein, partial [Deltaproteobacteria bacterium]
FGEGEEATLLLLQALKDPVAEIRVEAASSLRSFEGENILPALREALLDEDDRVREAAREGIDLIEARAGGKEALPFAPPLEDPIENFSTHNSIMDDLFLEGFSSEGEEEAAVEEGEVAAPLLDAVDHLDSAFLERVTSEDSPPPEADTLVVEGEAGGNLTVSAEVEHETGHDFPEGEAEEILILSEEDASEEILPEGEAEEGGELILLDERYAEDTLTTPERAENGETWEEGEILVLDENYCMSVTEEVREAIEAEEKAQGAEKTSDEGKKGLPSTLFTDYPEWTPGGSHGGVRIDAIQPAEPPGTTGTAEERRLEEARRQAKSPNPKERIAAIQKMAPVLDDPEPLLHLLRDDTVPAVRAVAAAAFVAMPTPPGAEVIQVLIRALVDPAPAVREAAARTLGEFASPEALQPLLEALEDDERTVRQAAAEALGSLRDPAALPGLLRLLEDDDHFVRESALVAIGELGDETLRPRVEDVYANDADVGVRTAAAYALARLGSPEGFPALLRFLGENDLVARMKAALYLGYLKDPAAVPALESACSDASALVRQTAEDALEKIQTP